MRSEDKPILFILAILIISIFVYWFGFRSSQIIKACNEASKEYVQTQSTKEVRNYLDKQIINYPEKNENKDTLEQLINEYGTINMSIDRYNELSAMLRTEPEKSYKEIFGGEEFDKINKRGVDVYYSCIREHGIR